MAPTADWKKLKRIICGRNSLKNLQACSRKKLKKVRSNNGKSLLHFAALHGLYTVNQYLIDVVGLDVNLEEKKNGCTPLSYALIGNNTNSKNIAKLLIKSGADVSWDKIKYKSDKFFKNRQIAKKFLSALKTRVSGSRDQNLVVDYLLSIGWTLENIACLYNENVTRDALKKEHLLNKNYEKLLGAIVDEDVHQVKLLLEFVAHSKKIMNWALLEAAKIRSPKSPIIIKLLLDNGASISGFSDNETNPLIPALMNRNVDNIWVLLDHGVDLGLRIPSSEQCTDIRILTEQERKEESLLAENCIRLLIEHRGVRNLDDSSLDVPVNLITLDRGMPRDLFSNYSYEHIRIEYKLMQRNLMRLDSPTKIVDKFRFSDELEKMKNYKVAKHLCLWNLLAKTIDEMIPLTRNQDLMNNLKSISFYKEFPNYGVTLVFKINKAIKKRLLIDHSIDVLKKCLPPVVGSCDLVLQRIIYFLGVPNLLCLE